MQLKSVFVRFYKSFNYDYVRKIKEGITQRPWEFINDQFYPYVEILIDSKITTIVGANESGKSHLLSAIEKGITGYSTSGGLKSPIGRKDFCRYSQFFKSTKGGPRIPDFGFEWVNLTGEDKKVICEACGVNVRENFDRFFSFRHGEKSVIYLPKPDTSGYDSQEVSNSFQKVLPHVFRIESDIALPDSVSIRQLIKGRLNRESVGELDARKYAYQVVHAAPELSKAIHSIVKPTPQPGQNSMSEAQYEELQRLAKELEPDSKKLKAQERERWIAEFNLAHDLIFKIANIDIEDIGILYQALQDSETGVVRSLVDNINTALATRLNFPRVWAQDRDFALRVEATEHELNFIINDRTGCQYSFDERSSGLKHFLSYYIQYLSHESKGSSEILLMDEPDAFLSGEAQQDLLKVFDMFAYPLVGKGEGSAPVQVIYVTHSPFLIDKNHAERVRAVEKAEGTKGTRVIDGAAQNHYEPLRSAFGSFVGETTFISQCNLMVEGLADQILLAGSATYLRKLQDVPESEMLDLNRITIVPAGGAANVPYLVFLARGRDAEKPAVIVQLDSDKDGDDAKRDLGKNGPHPRKKQIIDPKFVFQLGDICYDEVSDDASQKIEGQTPFRVLEDLIPLPLAIRAVKTFVKTIYDLTDNDIAVLNEEEVQKRNLPDTSFFETINQILSTINPDSRLHIDKVPFARTVIDLLPDLAEERQQGNGSHSGIDQFEINLRAVFKHLRQLQAEAEQDVKDKRMQENVDEKIAVFLNDHIGSVASRDEAARLLKDIESDLVGDDTVRVFISNEIVKLRAAHSLTEDLTEPTRNYENFCVGLRRLQNAKLLVFEATKAEVVPRKELRVQRPVVLKQPESEIPSVPTDGTTIASAVKANDVAPDVEAQTIAQQASLLAQNTSPLNSAPFVIDESEPASATPPLVTEASVAISNVSDASPQS